MSNDSNKMEINTTDQLGEAIADYLHGCVKDAVDQNVDLHQAVAKMDVEELLKQNAKLARQLDALEARVAKLES